MRASVSDIVTFRKCPRLWAWQRLWTPVKQSPALLRGIAAHSDVERFLKYTQINLPPQPEWAAHDAGVEATLLKQPITYMDIWNDGNILEVIDVEKPFEWHFRGHTIIGRPDALVQVKNVLGKSLFQLKTTARDLVSHIEYVRIHPHEIVYSAAYEELYGIEAHSTVLCRLIFKGTETRPEVNVYRMAHTPDIRYGVLDGLESTLNEMERYAEKEAKDLPAHSENCVNWFTGATCPHYKSCWFGQSPEDNEKFKRAETRYPEFAGDDPGKPGHNNQGDKEEYLREDI